MFFKFLKGATLVSALTALMCGSIFADVTKNISLSFSGLIDVDASYSNISNDTNRSNFDVDNAALNVVAKLGEEFTGTIVFWYDQEPKKSTNEFYVDEAKIEWKKNDKLSFTLGKFYIISTISNEFITDAIAKNLIELRRAAAMVSYKPLDYITLKGSIYNAGVHKNVKTNDHIRDYVLAAEYADDNYGLNAAYLSNCAEIVMTNVGCMPGVTNDSFVKTGASVVISGTAKIEKFNFLVETVIPVSKPLKTDGSKPSFDVYNFVAGYQINDKYRADARYEHTKSEMDGILIHKSTNIIGQLTYAYNENITLKAEYLNREEKNLFFGGVNRDIDQLTARVSYTF